MKLKTCSAILLVVLPVSLCLCGCRRSDRQDTVTGSAANASHTYRATVILRQYYVDGKFDTSPTTYVLLDPDSGAPNYSNGVDFKDSQVVMKPSQCGPLTVQWTGDHELKVICEKCGLALSAVGQHASNVGAIRIAYEGFPEMSSWEAAPQSNH
jgi:hypothetical protein